VSYTSVFNPVDAVKYTMAGNSACYRQEDTSSPYCPTEMFGADAPAWTWHMTFDHASLGRAIGFVPVSPDSPFYAMGDGTVVAQPKQCKGNNNGNGNNNNNNGNGNGCNNNGNGGTGGTGGPPPHH
jgi:hypothetical protein